VLGQAVVIATEAEDEVAGLPDVDAVSDVLEEEGETFPPRQRRHVALRQSQVSGEEEEEEEEERVRRLDAVATVHTHCVYLWQLLIYIIVFLLLCLSCLNFRCKRNRK